MQKGIIIYKSKYGAAKRYAGWLQEMTQFDCVEASDGAWSRAAGYEVIVMCGGIYASGIAGLSALRKNVGRLRGSSVFIFCVGASPYDREAFEALKARNLTGDLQGIPAFYGRGAWNERAMTGMDRLLCRLLQKFLRKKDPAGYAPWERALVDAAGKECDWSDRAYLRPLLRALAGGGAGV